MKILKLTTSLSLMLLIAATHGQAQSLQDVCQKLGTNPMDKQLIEQLRVMTRSLGDVHQKSLSGTLFCLSAMTMGDSRKAAAVKTILHKEFPSSLYLSFLEPAYSGDACAKCEGGGTYRKPCTQCGASGKCKTCKGTGESPMLGLLNETRSCMACKGTGACTSCAGRGSPSVACRACANGFAPSTLGARETYMALLKHGAEGGDTPQIRHATSLRAILAAMDAATQQARTTPSLSVIRAAVSQAQRQARGAIQNARIRISGTIKDVRPNGACRIQINLTELRQCLPELRDDTLQVKGLTAIDLAGRGPDAALFKRGAKLELYGTPELVTMAVGSPSFPLDCTPIATVGMTVGYPRPIIGTIVMRDYSVMQSRRLFKSPFATAPKASLAKPVAASPAAAKTSMTATQPTGDVSDDSFGALLCRLDAHAKAVDKAPTTILKSDVLAQFRKGGVALFTADEVDVYATVKDIKILGSGKVEIAFESVDLGSYASQAQKYMSLMRAGWRIAVPMTSARAREVRPGQRLTLHSRTSFSTKGGYSVTTSSNAADLELFKIIVSGSKIYTPVAGIRLKVLSYDIEGNGQDI